MLPRRRANPWDRSAVARPAHTAAGRPSPTVGDRPPAAEAMVDRPPGADVPGCRLVTPIVAFVNQKGGVGKTV